MIVVIFESITHSVIKSFYMSDCYYHNDEYIESQIVRKYPWINQAFPDWDYEIAGDIISPILAVN